MDELIKQVSAKTGLGADQTKTVVLAVIDYLKVKLPSPLAGQIDSLLNGSADMAGSLKDSATNALGDIFGKR